MEVVIYSDVHCRNPRYHVNKSFCEMQGLRLALLVTQLRTGPMDGFQYNSFPKYGYYYVVIYH